jgi:hypothetical protein
VLNENDTNEVGDGGTSDAEGNEYNVLFVFKME